MIKIFTRFRPKEVRKPIMIVVGHIVVIYIYMEDYETPVSVA